MTTVSRDELLAMRDRCNQAYYTTNAKIAQLALVDVSELLQRFAEGVDDAAAKPAAMAAELDGMSIRCRRASNTTNSKTAQNALVAAADIIRQIGVATADNAAIANPGI